VMKH